ncbi:uncharacterized protein M6B38_198000 [Iris pallida]|uniref:BAG domain-containing protein n=1 Tax=Iris pallida TaxID=29817 RepID=A0AAX6EC13_IRIPA|nr:uncharacterized protein M6B38_198000 [Iris pallida]
MENSYYRSPYNPIRHFQRDRHNHDFPQQSPKPKSKPLPSPKVVSIPVRFVESAAELNRRHSAAVKIQRHLRGLLVRRKVEAVRRIEVDVDEIERRIQRDLDLLLGEEKERIRTNEMLMALLLRLDSVRGVREYRKKVIRRVILLQETVDSLSAAAKPEDTGEKPLEDTEVQPETDRDRELPEETLINQELEINETLETSPEEISSVPDRGTPEETLENQEEAAVRFQEPQENTRDEGMKDQELAKEEVKTGFFVVEPMESQEERTGEDQEEIPVKEIVVVDEMASLMEGDDECSMIEEALEKDEPALKRERTEKENSEELGLKSVMERMVEENQTLKSMVAELCERSSLQCQLMGGLAKRVAQLEKTVQAMEKRKKKKRESK